MQATRIKARADRHRARGEHRIADMLDRLAVQLHTIVGG